MYAMDSAVHTEHSSEPRRARRESWRDRWHAPAQARTATEPHPAASATHGVTDAAASTSFDGFAD